MKWLWLAHQRDVTKKIVQVTSGRWRDVYLIIHEGNSLSISSILHGSSFMHPSDFVAELMAAKHTPIGRCAIAWNAHQITAFSLPLRKLRRMRLRLGWRQSSPA